MVRVQELQRWDLREPLPPRLPWWQRPRRLVNQPAALRWRLPRRLREAMYQTGTVEQLMPLQRELNRLLEGIHQAMVPPASLLQNQNPSPTDSSMPLAVNAPPSNESRPPKPE